MNLTLEHDYGTSCSSMISRGPTWFDGPHILLFKHEYLRSRAYICLSLSSPFSSSSSSPSSVTVTQL